MQRNQLVAVVDYKLLSKSIKIHSLMGIFIVNLYLVLSGCGPRIYMMQGDSGHGEVEVVERYGQSLRFTIESVPVLVLRGSYEELGIAHGVLAGKEIIEVLDSVLIPYVNKKHPDAWDRQILPVANTFVFPEKYEIELQGIMQGIKTKYPDRHDRMLFSVRREIRIDDLRALNSILDIMDSLNACSSFSAWGTLTENGKVICGRNLDQVYIPGKMPFMVLSREPADLSRKATIEISGPGFIGASTAINEDGVAVLTHYEDGLQTSHKIPWVPRAIVLRDAIESAGNTDSLEQIAATFKNRPVRVGNSTHICFPMSVPSNKQTPFVVEWDGNQKDEGVSVRTEDLSVTKDAIVCTNHFITRRNSTEGTSNSSRVRFETLADSLRECKKSACIIDFEKAAQIMDAVAQNGQTVTYLSVVVFPEERKLIFAITPGRGISATRGDWIQITWDQIFGVN